jgi:hypothetical protein
MASLRLLVRILLMSQVIVRPFFSLAHLTILFSNSICARVRHPNYNINFFGQQISHHRHPHTIHVGFPLLIA